MNSIELPNIFKSPLWEVSVLICSYNTNISYIRDCLNSLKHQNGHYNIELVWINDGSSQENTLLLEEELERFKNTMRFCRVIYKKMDENMGLSYCLNEGVYMCSNEIIFRMDSDDIMVPNRFIIQLEFMKNNKDAVICGSNTQYLYNTDRETKSNRPIKQTNHSPIITWQNYKLTKPHWIMNHPTLCVKKSAVLEVGNYNRDVRHICEDLELELKLLKKYGKLYNIKECLVLYRIHDEQETFNGKSMTDYWKTYRHDMINNLLKD
jgi:glycosyltransferase involved in cell wall biosynthesis